MMPYGDGILVNISSYDIGYQAGHDHQIEYQRNKGGSQGIFFQMRLEPGFVAEQIEQEGADEKS